MKKKFSKILGVGLTLALLISLLLVAAPVSALGTASVSVSPTTISAVDAEYNIRVGLDEQLTGTGSTAAGAAYNLVAIGDSFVLTATTGATTVTESKGTVAVAVSGLATVAYAGSTHTITFTGAGTATVTAATGDSVDGDITGTMSLGSATPVVTPRASDTITIVFPSGTVVDAAPTVTMTAGPGWINGVWTDADTPGITAVGTVDTRTVVITVDNLTRIGEGAEVRLSFTSGITNPDDAGDYNLTVETSQETTAVPSADYEITVPDIGVLPGIVQQFNAAGILMATATGDAAINTLVDSAGADYTIVVGPGEYEITAMIDLDVAGLTLESSGDTEDTIIDASAVSGNGILVDAADVTVDGFTIEDAGTTGIYINAAAVDAIIQDNVITFDEYFGTGIDINATATGATVSGNELNEYAIMRVNGSDATLSGNTFGESINISGTVDGLTITDNTMIGSEGRAIDFVSGGTFTNVLIEDNTISGAAPNAIMIRDVTVTNLRILNNEITDNEGVGIEITSGATIVDAIAIKFNTITGNDADNDGYGIQNGDDDAIVDASFNWWGTAVGDDVAAMVNDTGDSVTIYEPFLADTAEAVFSASDVAAGASSLDAEDTVGVRVVSITSPAGVIALAKYIANPQEAIADALAFYDVYVGTPDDPTDAVSLRFYVGDENSTLHVWSAGTESWAKFDAEDVGYSAYGGYVYVTVLADLLDGTPFVLVGVEAEADEVGAPTILAPDSGERDIPLTPTFSWTGIAGAAGYYFELADNANFVVPLVKMEGDLGLLVVTAYAYPQDLDYSTAYYWRVKAVSGTAAAGDLLESDWSYGVFITMDEPVEPTPPIEIVEAPDLPDIVIEQPDIIVESPDIIVPLPAETPITPSWIYVIIAVGGLLVISLIVLIVRTRRVA